jgi:hypothetical protein
MPISDRDIDDLIRRRRAADTLRPGTRLDAQGHPIASPSLNTPGLDLRERHAKEPARRPAVGRARRATPAGSTRGVTLLDPEGRFFQDAEGVVRFNFGKHQGQRARDHPGYLRWMLGQGLDERVQQVVRQVLGEA